MIEVKYEDIVTPELLKGAIENNEYEGFLRDYHILHCLLRIYNPDSVFEIGTNCGRGTSIICNAVPNAKVYSLDLPTELCHKSLQHPINEGHGDKVGHLCKFPYSQLRGDSMEFDYSQYPCQAYYVDGDHTEENVYHETSEILKCDPVIVIYHDTDIPEVFKGIQEAIDLWNKRHIGFGRELKREIYRVIDTRISYVTTK